MATSSNAPAASTPISSDGWNRSNATVLTICILGWAFDIYEATIMPSTEVTARSPTTKS